jgi:hypothetical protein
MNGTQVVKPEVLSSISSQPPEDRHKEGQDRNAPEEIVLADLAIQ